MNYLCKRNEDFSEDLVKYIRVKLAQSNDQILDKRYNYFIFNKLWIEYLDKCFKSKDHSRKLIEILGHYK